MAASSGAPGTTSPLSPKLPVGVSNSTPTGGTVGGDPASPFNGPVVQSGPSYNATGAGLPTLFGQTSPTTPAPAAATGGGAAGAAGGAAPTYGTNSGPGILQQWFGERANGTDPAYEYTTGRGLKALDTAAAARGGFNGGASMQQDSDYLANMGAQRQGQLDTLAGGASNENANQIRQMLGLGMGLAGGGAGTAGQYDTGAATDWTNAMNTGLSLSGQAAMIPYLARQQMMSQLMGGGMGMLSSLL